MLLDEAIGWGCRTFIGPGMTAYLNVDYKAPFPEDSEAIIRVYHDETTSRGRKMYFFAALRSIDDSVVFAEATSLFVILRSKL